MVILTRRSSMLEYLSTSLEGKAEWNYQACDKKGDLSARNGWI